MEKRRIDMVGPTLLIGIGAILLLNNVGYLDWSLWDVVRLWPILLIAAGLEVLLGRKSVWGSAVAAAVVIALIAGAIWLGGTVGIGTARGAVEEISYGLSDVGAARIRLEPAIGDITIGALVDSAELIEGTVQLNRREELRRRYDEDDPAELILSTQADRAVGIVGLNPGSMWRLDINSGVALELAVNLGIGSAEIDLGNLTVDEARVDFGIGSADISLPQEGQATVRVDGGIGSVQVSVPEDVGVRIALDSGLVGRSMPSTYQCDGDMYTSPNYRSADVQVDVDLSLGIGNIRVTQD